MGCLRWSCWRGRLGSAARSLSLGSGEAFARTGAERTCVREHRTGAKTSRSGRSPARWTESTEAYGPSEARERRRRSEARTQDQRASSPAEMRPMVSRLPDLSEGLRHERSARRQPEALVHRGLRTPRKLLQAICGWAATRCVESLAAAPIAEAFVAVSGHFGRSRFFTGRSEGQK